MKTVQQKLTAVCSLKFGGGIGWIDRVDAVQMRIKCGPHMNTDELNDKQIERINALYDQFFEA